MAAFTSTQSGNWNDGAQWGGASPGVKGVDWPGAAGDTFNVAAGHTITYNVSETNELGASQINGILTFKNDLNTKLIFGQCDLDVKSGGELRIGASGAVIDKANTAELYWNPTNNSMRLEVETGGKLTIYGDPDYYGSDDDTYLADDAENTDGDAWIKVVDDMSARWNVGDNIYIHIKNAYNSRVTDVLLGVIQNFGVGNKIELDINVTADASCQGKVINASRNVKIGKLNAVTTIGNFNTNRPNLVDSNEETESIFSNVLIEGNQVVRTPAGAIFEKVVIRNGYYGCSDHNVETGFHQHSIKNINIISCYYGFNGVGNSEVSGNVLCCVNAIDYGVNSDIYSDIYSNAYSIIHGKNIKIYGHIYGNNAATSWVYSVCYIYGAIGYDALGKSKPQGGYDICMCTFVNYYVFNVKLPVGGFRWTYRNIKGKRARVHCEHHDQVANANKIYDSFGDIVKVAADGGGDRPSVDPDGNNGDLIELSDIQTNCSQDDPLLAWDEYEYRIWTVLGSKIYRFYVQTTYAGITAGNLKLTANYLDQATGGHEGEQTHAPVIAQRANDADWTQYLEVTVNPSQTGWITFKIELMEYELNNEVYIWPEVEII